jgi:hypothetical protein
MALLKSELANSKMGKCANEIQRSYQGDKDLPEKNLFLLRKDSILLKK